VAVKEASEKREATGGTRISRHWRDDRPWCAGRAQPILDRLREDVSIFKDEFVVQI